MFILLFSKPIISRYATFNSRDIIYEDVFGNRKEFKVYRPFVDLPFPKETDSVDYKTYQHILNGGDYERIGSIVFKKESITI